jgi:hypothetical protein
MERQISQNRSHKFNDKQKRYIRGRRVLFGMGELGAIQGTNGVRWTGDCSGARLRNVRRKLAASGRSGAMHKVSG